MSEEFLYVEKYRPHKVDDCILPEAIKNTFKGYVAQRQIPHLLLAGSPGTGKTTAAKAMCDEIGLNYLFINSSEERGIDTLRIKIKNYASTKSLDGGSKVIILDEADNITPDAQKALRGAMEAYSKNCTFILTCNFKSKLLDAIQSRCAVIDFKIDKNEENTLKVQFLRRLIQILESEGKDHDEKVLAKIVTHYFPDYRRTLNEIQRITSNGDIDIESLSNMTYDLKEVFDYLKEKEFGKMREWVLKSSLDPTMFFRQLYDHMTIHLKNESVPQAVLIIANYQYKAAFVADQEINIVACLTELMADCEWL